MLLQYTKKDEEIAEIFKSIGLKSNEARVLVLFFKDTEFSSREVERITDLRQPEVSIALTLLMKKQWVQITRHITEKKGRPVKIYNLSASIDDILDQIKAEMGKDYRIKIEHLERVRLMVREARVME